MKPFIVAAAAFLPTPTLADVHTEILGKWICTDNQGSAVATSQVSFHKNRRMKAKMEIEAQRGDDLMLAKVIYRADYRITGNAMVDHPLSARITALTLNGHDIRRTAMAGSLKDTLMEDSGTTARIRFPAEGYMFLEVKDRVVQCHRPDRTPLTS